MGDSWLFVDNRTSKCHQSEERVIVMPTDELGSNRINHSVGAQALRRLVVVQLNSLVMAERLQRSESNIVPLRAGSQAGGRGGVEENLLFLQIRACVIYLQPSVLESVFLCSCV